MPKVEFPRVTLADWRARVEKELAGRSFDKVLVHETPEGLSIAPLYTEAERTAAVPRDAAVEPFRICVRAEPQDDVRCLEAEIEEGADGVWLGLDQAKELKLRDDGRAFFVFDADGVPVAAIVDRVTERLCAAQKPIFALRCDPIGDRARLGAGPTALSDDLTALGRNARTLAERFERGTSVMVSTLPYHSAGADGADEIAIALSTGVRYLEALANAGLSMEQAAGQIALQIAIGRDTFVELCKMRALRVCWEKVLVASGVAEVQRARVHAVCSERTLTVRDPWVNMLRVTTQLFAGVLGGADWVTPNTFDGAFGATSASSRRIARNTGLVLREESFLGKVVDPAAGSYYFDTLTLALAREAWKRFQVLEQDGGIVTALESGRLATRLSKAWDRRAEQIGKRRLPILGVSEFANLEEKLPSAAPNDDAANRAAAKGGETDGAGRDRGQADGARAVAALPLHRDAAPFEELRARASNKAHAPEVVLVTLGAFAESRARVGFAQGFFAAGGLRSREVTTDEKARVACLCGTDERYAAEAATRARALKAAGCERVLLAGRPGALEASLRDAGVDGFIFVGCDGLAVLGELVERFS